MINYYIEHVRPQNKSFHEHIESEDFLAPYNNFIEKYFKNKMGWKETKFPELILIDSNDKKVEIVTFKDSSYVVFDYSLNIFINRTNQFLLTGKVDNSLYFEWYDKMTSSLAEYNNSNLAIILQRLKVFSMLVLQFGICEEDIEDTNCDQESVDLVSALVEETEKENHGVSIYKSISIGRDISDHPAVKSLSSYGLHNSISKATGSLGISGLFMVTHELAHNFFHENDLSLEKIYKAYVNEGILDSKLSCNIQLRDISQRPDYIKEELICDLFATELVWDYLTDEYCPPSEVIREIYLTSISLLIYSLIQSLSFSLLEKSTALDDNFTNDLLDEYKVRHAAVTSMCEKLLLRSLSNSGTAGIDKNDYLTFSTFLQSMTRLNYQRAARLIVNHYYANIIDAQNAGIREEDIYEYPDILFKYLTSDYNGIMTEEVSFYYNEAFKTGRIQSFSKIIKSYPSLIRLLFYNHKMIQRRVKNDLN